MASLMTLPLELLVSVSTYLTTPDLASLRLTCKQAEKSLFEWFSQEFFTKKQFMLTHSSLQTFIDISKHVSFSKRLAHVIIATNLYQDPLQQFRDEQSALRYIQGYESQKILLSTGVDREMLTEAFANLVNLQTVGIRDFNAHRPRDGASAHWSSWGATTVKQDTGVALEFSGMGSSIPDFVSHVFTNVLYALGKAHRKPKEFEVLLRRGGLNDTALSLPEFIQPSISPVLNSLTTLLLNVELDARYSHTYINGNIQYVKERTSLQRFFTRTPNLKHLRLNFSKFAMVPNTNFLEWLGEQIPTSTSATTSTSLDPMPIQLPYLKQLDLGQLSVRPDTLLPIIKKFAKTLEGVSFWRMTLHTHMLPPPGHKPNYWADLFIRMSQIGDLKLKHLKVGRLQQNDMYVSFKDEGQNENAQLLQAMEYSAKGLENFYADAAERVVVNWPEPVQRKSDNDDEDVEDEDMMDTEYEEEADEDEEDDGDEDNE